LQHLDSVMTTESVIRVLVIDEDCAACGGLASFLSARHYDVQTCSGIETVPFVAAHWRPHVFVLATRVDKERHRRLEELRRLYPTLPVVMLTAADGPDLLLDVEAFAPTLPVRPARGHSGIEHAVGEVLSLRA
jgi:DNA-binding NtrC family response regulator